MHSVEGVANRTVRPTLFPGLQAYYKQSKTGQWKGQGMHEALMLNSIKDGAHMHYMDLSANQVFTHQSCAYEPHS